MNELLTIIIPAIIAFICTKWIHPYIFKISKSKNIVDNPNARKLQRVPIPVLGGFTVVFGMLTGIMGFSLLSSFDNIFTIFAMVVIILIIGFIDDTIALSAKVRFVIEIILILYLISVTGNQINHFHGVWGVQMIPNYVSIPLTIVSCVGIMNAINLIDGVDGYSSGYSIVACTLFGAMFYHLGNIHMATLSAIVIASLIPFFLHNVFGKYSKMFIGDSGSLSLGIVFSVFVTELLSANNINVNIEPNLCLVPFALAVLCIPVFDTLRVMAVRIWRGKSPVSPDKTHLHHLFVELGFSHIGTTMSIISINIFVVLCWFVAYKCGLSASWQLFIVVALGVFVTFIFYPFMKAQIRRNSAIFHRINNLAQKSHLQDKAFWCAIQKWVDRDVKYDFQKPTSEA